MLASAPCWSGIWKWSNGFAMKWFLGTLSILRTRQKVFLLTRS